MRRLAIVVSITAACGAPLDAQSLSQRILRSEGTVEGYLG